MNITGQRLYATGTDAQGAPCVAGERRYNVRITGLGTEEHPFDAPDLVALIRKSYQYLPAVLQRHYDEVMP